MIKHGETHNGGGSADKMREILLESARHTQKRLT
jgi:hypothetical protein